MNDSFKPYRTITAYVTNDGAVHTSESAAQKRGEDLVAKKLEDLITKTVIRGNKFIILVSKAAQIEVLHMIMDNHRAFKEALAGLEVECVGEEQEGE
jgi:hypothetical protein